MNDLSSASQKLLDGDSHVQVRYTGKDSTT